MTISVIIATYNRAALLDECLAHLAGQDFERGDEVIVVDNGSTDSTQEVIGRYRDGLGVPLRSLFEERPGKSHALARAIAAASGDVLAFTDDDVDVDRGWVAAIRRTMADGEVALIGGPVAPRWERRPPRWLRFANGYGRLAAPLALIDYGAAPMPLGERAAIGANLAVRREALAAVGGFAPHLGKLRGTLLSGEDHDLCDRVRRAGLTARYCPDVRVSHWVPADRARAPYILRWFYWSGITHALMDGEATPCRTILRVPVYLLRRMAAGALGALAAAASSRLDKAMDRAIDVAFAAGYVAARWRVVSVPGPRAVAAARAAAPTS